MPELELANDRQLVARRCAEAPCYMQHVASSRLYVRRSMPRASSQPGMLDPASIVAVTFLRRTAGSDDPQAQAGIPESQGTTSANHGQ